MDKERKEKTPASSTRGKTSSTRCVRSRVSSPEVEGFEIEEWNLAGVSAKRFIAYLLWSAEHQPNKWSRRKPRI
jgi:hypothetical protein